jgi:membrane-associated protein
MEMIHQLMELLHNLGEYQFWSDLVSRYGILCYLIFFIIIFAETGFVVTPFLPGDSLLFAAGMVCGVGGLSLPLLILILFIAAFTGNSINYFIGRWVGPAIFEKEKIPLIKKKHLTAAHDYYEKNGSKAVILARFVPFIRTFVPFVAGIAKMERGKYLLYTLIGAVAWVVPFTVAGYLLGQNQWVQLHFKHISLTIVILTLIPLVWSFIKDMRAKNEAV